MQRYLIIAGSTRCGTTSLFDYFSAHPEVCPAQLKETRFFLDPKYRLPVSAGKVPSWATYDDYFKNCQNGMIRMEATPDYIYSSETAEHIAKALPGAKIVVALRDPIARLGSWYRFACQLGRLPRGTGFNDYVRGQMKREATSGMETQRIAMQQGRYYNYVKRFFDVFGHRNICVVWSETLFNEPLLTLEKLAHFSGIDANWFASFDASPTNEARDARFPAVHRLYMKAGRLLRLKMLGRRGGAAALKHIKQWMSPAYTRLNLRAAPPVEISPRLRLELVEYYQPSVGDLEALVGEKVPWSSFSPKG